MKHFYKILLLLLLAVTGVAYAEGNTPTISCSQDTCYLVNNQAGKFIIGTKGDYDLELLTGQGATATGLIVDATTGDLKALDGTTPDLGTLTQPVEDVITDGKIYSGLGETALDADVTTIATANPLLLLNGSSGVQAHMALVQSVASAQGAEFLVAKTRASVGGTGASTIVVSGDDVYKQRFFGANGTSFDEIGYFLAEIGGTPGASADMPGQFVFALSPDGSATPAAVLTLTQAKAANFTGAITSSATSDVGWAVVAGADTACNTTCTSACVFGVNTAATEADIVACTDNTADECLCAGAS